MKKTKLNTNQKIMLSLIIIISLILIIYFLPIFIEKTGPVTCMGEDGQCLHELRINELITLIPLFIGIGAIFGVLIYYLISEYLNKKNCGCSSNLTPQKITIQTPEPKVITKYKTKYLKKIANPEVILKLLNKDEKKIISFILNNEGKCLQSEISRLEGIGKVKSHRYLNKLIKQGVIIKESHGKTNIIMISKEFKELFKK